MPDWTQINNMSRASGNASLIEVWRFWIKFSMKMLGAYEPMKAATRAIINLISGG